jgi:tetratricopeptide (TPR) repeat protein
MDGPVGGLWHRSVRFSRDLSMLLARLRTIGPSLLLGLVMLPASRARADEPASAPAAVVDHPGQDDLNAAIDAKFEINEIDDYARVLDLCKRAIAKGLDDGSRKFAEDLYTGTLLDRAAMLVAAILEAEEPDPEWRRIRSFAMRDLNEVVSKDPNVGSAQLMIARLETLPGGNRERATAAATKALELIADDQLQRAQATLVLAGLEEDAAKQKALYDAAVELAPRDVEVRRARGLFRYQADDYAGACDDLAVAIEEDGDDASLHEALGMACMMIDRLKEARAALDRALEIDPDSPGPLLQRARVLAIEGNRDDALADIDRVIDARPRDPRDVLMQRQARLLRARILQQAGDSEQALADIEAVLEQDEENPAALEMKGLLAAEREDYPEAIRAFRRLVQANRDDPVVLTQLGMLYLAAKQPREAIRRFTRAIELDADSFVSRRGRSDAAITIGDHKAAVTDLEKALTIEADDSGILNNLAWILATSPDDELRDGGRAVELATKACEVTEWKQAHIISTLAAGYAERGDFDNARKYARQAVETGTAAGGEDEIRGQLEKELASYEEGKPWRERQEMAEAGEAGSVQQEKPDSTEPPRRPFDE